MFPKCPFPYKPLASRSNICLSPPYHDSHFPIPHRIQCRTSQFSPILPYLDWAFAAPPPPSTFFTTHSCTVCVIGIDPSNLTGWFRLGGFPSPQPPTTKGPDNFTEQWEMTVHPTGELGLRLSQNSEEMALINCLTPSCSKQTKSGLPYSFTTPILTTGIYVLASEEVFCALN